MAEPSAETSENNRRLCPTRASGAHSLIAHWITPTTCLERQRRNYHKCYTCQYRGQGAALVLPVPPKAAAPEPPVSVTPVRRARSKATKASTGR